MSAPPRIGKLDVAGDRRSVTVTFGYEGLPRTLVAQNLRLALAAARQRWGKWSTVESISTPESIYADVTGFTLSRHTPGEATGPDPSMRARLQAAGHTAGPDEIGARSYWREVLPNVRRDPNAPSTDPADFKPGRSTNHPSGRRLSP